MQHVKQFGVVCGRDVAKFANNQDVAVCRFKAPVAREVTVSDVLFLTPGKF